MGYNFKTSFESRLFDVITCVYYNMVVIKSACLLLMALCLFGIGAYVTSIMAYAYYILVISGAPQYYGVICKLIPLVFVFVYLCIMVIWLRNVSDQYGICALIQYKNVILPI